MPRANRRQKEKKYSIFASHATHDKWVARIICEKLEAVGITTFRDDRDIEGGDCIPNTICEQIKSCDELVVLITPESLSRQWVLIEIGMAFAVGRRIVPILYHVDATKMPDIIRDTKAHLLNDLDDYVKEALKRAKDK